MKNKLTPFAVLVSFVVSIGGLLLGMSSTIGGAVEFFKLSFQLTPLQEGFAVSAAMLGTFVGNSFVGKISDSIGRKKSLFFAAFLFVFLSLGSAFSPNFIILVLTRFIGGLGIGISLLVAPMYIAEFAPSKYRGFLVSFNQLNVGIGFLLAAICNSYIDSTIVDPSLKWRFMLGLPTIFPVLYAILLLFVPESPRWLLTKGRNVEALAIMEKTTNPDQALQEYTQIIDNSEPVCSEKQELSFNQQLGTLFSKPMRRIVVIAFSIMIFQMLSGLNNVFFFGPKIFRMSGASSFMSPFLQANIIGLAMVIMTIVAMFVIDRLGRKPLLYLGVSAIAIASVLVGSAFHNAEYFLEKEDVDIVYNSVIENAIKDKARQLDDNLYGVDKVEIIDNNALLYKANSNDVLELRLTLPNLRDDFNDAYCDALLLRNILEGIDKENVSERAFFKHIKQQMNLDSKLFLTINYYSVKDLILDNAIHVNSLLVLIGLILIVVGFSISLGPIAWAMLSEIFPSNIRGLGFSIAGALNGITSYMVTSLFPYELEVFGVAITYFIFAGFMVLCLVFVYTIYPETKGKTLEDIEKELIIKKQ